MKLNSFSFTGVSNECKYDGCLQENAWKGVNYPVGLACVAFDSGGLSRQVVSQDR